MFSASSPFFFSSLKSKRGGGEKGGGRGVGSLRMGVGGKGCEEITCANLICSQSDSDPVRPWNDSGKGGMCPEKKHMKNLQLFFSCGSVVTLTPRPDPLLSRSCSVWFTDFCHFFFSSLCRTCCLEREGSIDEGLGRRKTIVVVVFVSSFFSLIAVSRESYLQSLYRLFLAGWLPGWVLVSLGGER